MITTCTLHSSVVLQYMLVLRSCDMAKAPEVEICWRIRRVLGPVLTAALPGAASLTVWWRGPAVCH